VGFCVFQEEALHVLLLQVGEIVKGLDLGPQLAALVWAAVGGVMLYRMLKNGHSKNGSSRELRQDLKEDLADQMTLLAARMEIVIGDAVRKARRE